MSRYEVHLEVDGNYLGCIDTRASYDSAFKLQEYWNARKSVKTWIKDTKEGQENLVHKALAESIHGGKL